MTDRPDSLEQVLERILGGSPADADALEAMSDREVERALGALGVDAERSIDTLLGRVGERDPERVHSMDDEQVLAALRSHDVDVASYMTRAELVISRSRTSSRRASRRLGRRAWGASAIAASLAVAVAIGLGLEVRQEVERPILGEQARVGQQYEQMTSRQSMRGSPQTERAPTLGDRATTTRLPTVSADPERESTPPPTSTRQLERAGSEPMAAAQPSVVPTTESLRSLVRGVKPDTRIARVPRSDSAPAPEASAPIAVPPVPAGTRGTSITAPSAARAGTHSDAAVSAGEGARPERAAERPARGLTGLFSSGVGALVGSDAAPAGSEAPTEAPASGQGGLESRVVRIRGARLLRRPDTPTTLEAALAQLDARWIEARDREQLARLLGEAKVREPLRASLARLGDGRLRLEVRDARGERVLAERSNSGDWSLIAREVPDPHEGPR